MNALAAVGDLAVLHDDLHIVDKENSIAVFDWFYIDPKPARSRQRLVPGAGFAGSVRLVLNGLLLER